MSVVGSSSMPGTLEHPALLYRGGDEYLAGVMPFLQEGITASETVVVAVPGAKLDLIRGSLDSSGGEITFVDMAAMGRNPSRIIPAIRRLTSTHPGHRTRFLSEPVWPGRSPAEVQEAVRHEGLVNAAFTGVPVTILCPYDIAGLPADVLEDVYRTHPVLLERGKTGQSRSYRGMAVALAISEQSLPSPPAGAEVHSFGRENLPGLRRCVEHFAAQASVPAERIRDLVVAVNEVTTNTVVHAKATGVLRMWRDGDTVVCEVSDPGHITDPLVGRYLPSLEVNGGQGLWLVNQVCDLVELRSGPWGNAIRMHMGYR